MSPILGIIFSLYCIIYHQQVVEAFEGNLSCVDEDGESVDWFVVYKFPEIRDSSNRLVKSGYAYSYLTSSPTNNQVKIDRTGENLLVNGHKIGSRISTITAQLLDGLKISRNNTSDSDRSRLKGRRNSSNRKQNKRDNDVHWTISDKLITDDDSMVLRTISPAFKVSRRGSNIKSDHPLDFIFYSDQPPSGGPSSNEDRAHSKGVVLMDETSGRGIWITHSTPRFPPQHLNELKFEKNAAINGQTFMCITFDITKMGNSIAKHLVTMSPQVYDHILSEKLLTIVPELRNLKIGRQLSIDSRAKRFNSRKKQVRDEQLHQTIQTLNGQKLELFSKSKDFKIDLYSSWLADKLNSDLLVETWRIGGGTPLNSSCPLHGHKVNNVSDLKINLDSDGEIDWQYTHDHSKWAISQEEDHGYVCIGDINRMHSQFRRGGGIMCLKSKRGWKLFRNTIKGFERC